MNNIHMRGAETYSPFLWRSDIYQYDKMS